MGLWNGGALMMVELMLELVMQALMKMRLEMQMEMLGDRPWELLVKPMEL